MSDGNSRFTTHSDGSVSSAYITSDGFITMPMWTRDPRTFSEHEGTLRMDVQTFIYFLKALQPEQPSNSAIGDWGIIRIIMVGMKLAGYIPTRKDEEQLMFAISQLEQTTRKEWEGIEDFLTDYTYIMLHNRRMTHNQAADLVSDALHKDVTKDAWRMRIKKWAERQELPPVAQRVRKPLA